jgi:hypothetical protein
VTTWVFDLDNALSCRRFFFDLIEVRMTAVMRAIGVDRAEADRLGLCLHYWHTHRHHARGPHARA